VSSNKARHASEKALIEELLRTWDALQPAERRLWLALGERIAKGQQKYGGLAKTHTVKDWNTELFEELEDVAIYACILRLMDSLVGGRGLT